MAQPETFRKRTDSYIPTEGDPDLPKGFVAPLSDKSPAKATKWRILKILVVTLAVLVPFPLALNLLLRTYPQCFRELQAQSRRIQTRLGLKHHTDRHKDCRTYHVHDSSMSAHRNVTFARRQENKKYTFSIPIASKTYQFTSWGSIDKSVIRVTRFESDAKQIKVDVEVTKDPRKIARVFKLPVVKAPAVGSGQIYGVGFWARSISNRKDWPAFSVNVQVPTTNGQQQHLNSFETRLSNFDHELKNLYNLVTFTRLYLSTTNSKMVFEKVGVITMIVYNTNGPVKLDNVLAINLWVRSTNRGIKLDNVKASVGKIKTTNGEISGRAWSNKELSVATTNNRITAEFTLVKSGTVKLDTTNGKIFGDIKLQSKEAETGSAQPNYRILASTNHPLRLKVSEQPVGSGCWVSAWSASAVKVEMPPAYEGRFSFYTVQNRGKVEKKGQLDPAGRGRQRFVAYDRPRSTASGRTGWGSASDKEQHARGEVRVTARRGPAEIVFN